jgi:DNA end-binding protein Ku
MKSIWTGAIGFGLVNIPIKMYSASQSSDLDLHMLDSHDQANIHFKRVNAETGKEVAWKDIVKGYKLDDKYVILSEEDFERASPKKSKIIEISSFVKTEEIDSVYFETPYYLEPEKSGAKAYALFREALEKSDRAGIGTFVMRNKEHVCMLRSRDKVIVLNTMRFAEEIRSPKDITVPATSSVKPAELKMANSLIDQLTHPFDIKKFKDTYADDLLKLIHAKAKAKGKKVSYPKMKVTHRKSDDLMSQLKASLKQAS